MHYKLASKTDKLYINASKKHVKSLTQVTHVLQPVFSGNKVTLKTAAVDGLLVVAEDDLPLVADQALIDAPPMDEPSVSTDDMMDLDKGGSIIFSTDVDDRNKWRAKRVSPETGEVTTEYDITPEALMASVKGWLKTEWNRMNVHGKTESALRDFFRAHKVFAGYTLMKGRGQYIDAYDTDDEGNALTNKERSVKLTIRGISTAQLKDLAKLLLVQFSQKQVLIEDDNTGKVGLYPA